MFTVDLPKDNANIIKVIGVGGGGGNAVKHMYGKGIQGVDFFVCNTDAQYLEINPVPNKIQIGKTISEGLGAGSKPEVGKQCALESIQEIEEMLLGNAKMVFITAGMGGGTGTGAAPVIAQLAKDNGVLTIGIVTTPFKNEGPMRNKLALDGIEELRPNVDALLIISNDRILQMYGDLKISQAFAKADDVLLVAAKGIADIITVAGNNNVDFRDVQTAMKNSGRAIMGMGFSDSENRALDAAAKAMLSPLLDDGNIDGAKHILLNISYEKEEPYASELEQILSYFQNEAGQNAILKFGITEMSGLGNGLQVTVIATGFDNDTQIEILEEDNTAVLDDMNEGSIEVTFEEEQQEELSGLDLFTSPNTFGDRGSVSMPFDTFDKASFTPTKDNTQEKEGIYKPAYLRMNIQLDEVDVEERSTQKLYLEDKDGEVSLKESKNKFLNKDLD